MKSTIYCLCSCICLLFTSCQTLVEHQTPSQRNVESTILRRGLPGWSIKTQSFNDRQRLVGVEFTSATQGWVAGAEDVLYQTSDGGETWQQIKVEAERDSYITSFSFADTSTGWVTVRKDPSDIMDARGYVSSVLNTSDGGRTWHAQYNGDSLQIFRAHFINMREGWVVGRRLDKGIFVLHTSDQGSHWRDVSAELNRNAADDFATDIYATEPDRAKVLTVKGKVFSTDNGGQNWIEVGAVRDEPRQTFMSRIGVSKTDKLWFLGSTDSLEGMWTVFIVLADAGLTRYRVADVMLNDAAFLSEKQVLACGSIYTSESAGQAKEKRDGVILYSSDSGHNWTIIYQTANVSSINALSLIDPNHIWAVGEDGLALRLEPSSEGLSVPASK